jgi:hypothetical protein
MKSSKGDDNMTTQLYKIRENNKFGFMNTAGEVVIEPQYYKVEDYYNGFSIATFNNKPVPLDNLGRLLMKHLFNFVGKFEERKARARLVSKWGYIDERGSLVIDVQFDQAENFSEGLAAVKVEGFWGFINHEGDYAITPRFFSAGHFKHGLAPVRFTEDGLFGFVDKEGRTVIKASYEKAYPFQGELAVFEQEGKWGFINRKGDVEVPPLFDIPANPFYGQFHDGKAVIIKDNVYGYINQNCKLDQSPSFAYALDYSEGLGVVKLDNKFGYLDLKSDLQIMPDFDAASSFSGGMAAVKKRNMWGYINKEGKTIIPFRYDAAYPFKNGLALVEKEDIWSYINIKGDVIWCESINDIDAPRRTVESESPAPMASLFPDGES